MAEPVENNPSKIGYQVPGGCLAIFAASVLVFAFWQLADPKGIVDGLRSYFWESKTGTVVQSDMRFHGRSGGGIVRYSVEVSGQQVVRTTEVSRRWSWNPEGKFREWSTALEPGKKITIFVSGGGETSLGHWPREYTWSSALMGAFWIWFGWRNLRTGLERLRAERGSRQRSSASQS
jgi:hypothetical protein